MLLYKISSQNDNIIECLYESTNLLKTTYIKDKEKLYVYFRKGYVYSYSNVEHMLYEQFETSESQGIFLSEYIIKDKVYPSFKEFKMMNFEIDDIEKTINEIKDNGKPNIN